MNYDLLRKKPFNLTDAGVAWVKDTLEDLTVEEKIGQLFCLIAYSSEEEVLKTFVTRYKIGGCMGRPMPLEEICETIS